MTITEFKRGDGYFGALHDYLKSPSGAALSRLMLETDAALDLPPEIEKLLKGMDVMQMLAFNHACLIGWRSAWRFIQSLSNPAPVAPKRVEEFSTDPSVQEWDRQIAENLKRVQEDLAKQQAQPIP